MSLPESALPEQDARQTAPLLQVQDLWVSLDTAHGRTDALRGVNLSLQRGQTLGLIGESGCGKSMTALALMGLLPAGARWRGRMMFDGQDLGSFSEAQWCGLRGRQIAMVFQEPMTALNPLHTIGAQIAEPMRLHLGHGAAQARAEALRLLQRVQLPQAAQRLDAYPHQLSGGQRQRVLIAIALACKPRLLVADEPTTALDVTVQREVLQLIRQLVAEEGMGLLLISHDLGVMAHTVQQLRVMYAGRVVEAGPTAEVFARLAHPYTRGLLAARPLLGRRRDAPRQPLATIAGRVPQLHEMPPGCSFAPRCSRAQAACSAALPPLSPVEPVGPAGPLEQVGQDGQRGGQVGPHVGRDVGQHAGRNVGWDVGLNVGRDVGRDAVGHEEHQAQHHEVACFFAHRSQPTPQPQPQPQPQPHPPAPQTAPALAQPHRS